MKKRRKVLAALISLLALAASMRIVYVSGFLTHNYPAQNTRVFTKKGDPLRCDGITYRAGDTSGTRSGVLRPGTNWNTQIEVSNLRIERWHKRATIGIYAGKLRNVTAEGGAPILPWESPLHLKESAPSLCSTSKWTGSHSPSATTKQETPRPIASNPPPDSTSATTTKATTKNNIRTHPHPGLRPLPNKQNRRSSQPTGKGQLTSQTRADHRNKPRAEPATNPQLRIPASPPTQRKTNR